MTVQECYEVIGGDFEEVCERMMDEARVRKFALKFLSDKSYGLLVEAYEDDKIEDAFRAAHTLKGVCQNLGFTRLFEISNEITEELRPLQKVDISDKMAQLKEVYDVTISALSQLENG